MTEAPPPSSASPSDPSSPAAGASIRIGSAERQQAMDALDVHMSAGRIDPDEYGERVAKASVARTTAELEPLFADLPQPHGAGPSPASGPAWTSGSTAPSAPSYSSAPSYPSAPPAPSYPSAPPAPPAASSDGRAPLGGRKGEVAVGASPFVALLLFFLTNGFWHEAWLVFLLVPLTAVVVYGKDGDRGRERC